MFGVFGKIAVSWLFFKPSPFSHLGKKATLSPDPRCFYRNKKHTVIFRILATDKIIILIITYTSKALLMTTHKL